MHLAAANYFPGFPFLGLHLRRYPVAFSRRCLEKWHRRAGGRCPLTGAPMDLKEYRD